MNNALANQESGLPKPGILSGSGHREDPFVVGAANPLSSVALQAGALNSIFGPDAYAQGKREYHESANAHPGNRDLCEYKLLRDGKPFSVWFDLYLISRLQKSPEFVENERALFPPAMRLKMDEASAALDLELTQCQRLPKILAKSELEPSLAAQPPEPEVGLKVQENLKQGVKERLIKAALLLVELAFAIFIASSAYNTIASWPFTLAVGTLALFSGEKALQLILVYAMAIYVKVVPPKPRADGAGQQSQPENPFTKYWFNRVRIVLEFIAVICMLSVSIIVALIASRQQLWLAWTIGTATFYLLEVIYLFGFFLLSIILWIADRRTPVGEYFANAVVRLMATAIFVGIAYWALLQTGDFKLSLSN